MAMDWVQKGVPALVLAPMEGVTDAPMRALLTEIGGVDYCVSEFLRVSQEVPPKKVFFSHIPELKNGGKTPSGIRVQVQLLGGDAEKLALSAAHAAALGAQAIDLNFGCPAPTVNRHDGGATLLKYPLRIRAIVEAVRKAVPRELPVSAKLRLGWDDPQAIEENAERAAEGGANWITIHGRTKAQGYQPPAYWGPIGLIRRRLSIPVIANGDIWNLEDWKRCRDETGSEHFMLGRGLMANPYLARQIQAFREKNSDFETDGAALQRPRAWLQPVERFLSLSDPFVDYPPYLVKRVKQWFRYAALQKAISWFDQVKTLQSIDEIIAFLQADRIA